MQLQFVEIIGISTLPQVQTLSSAMPTYVGSIWYPHSHIFMVISRQGRNMFRHFVILPATGEDFSHYLPDPIDPIDPSAKSKIHVSKIIKRRRSSSAMPDIKGAATSKPCRLPATPPSRPKHGLRHLLRHLANSLPPKKRINKIASSSGGIHAFSFTDSKIGCPYPTDSSDVLLLHTLEPDIRCTEGPFPVENRMFENGSVTSRRSTHSNNFTLVSRRSQSVSNVIDHVSDAALQATPTCQSKSSGSQATPISQYKPTETQATPTCQPKATSPHTTPTCQLISHHCSGTQQYPVAMKAEMDEALSTVKGSSVWKRILTTFQKGVDRQSRRCYRRPLEQPHSALDVADK